MQLNVVQSQSLSSHANNITLQSQAQSNNFTSSLNTKISTDSNSSTSNFTSASSSTNMPQGDPGILCFQHCDKKSKVFCLEMPDYCPICDSPMSVIQLKIPPFTVPFPFTKARKVPCTVIIRPTEGDFLHHYRNAADLHIAVTNSNGDVYEFDRYGLHVGSQASSWNQCLSVPIVSEIDSMWREYWDYTLDITSQLDNWQPEKYCEEDNNCYSFVMTFLRMLDIKDLKPSLNSKTQFCKDFFVPRTKNAAKFIALYRRVIKEGVSVVSLVPS